MLPECPFTAPGRASHTPYREFTKTLHMYLDLLWDIYFHFTMRSNLTTYLNTVHMFKNLHVRSWSKVYQSQEHKSQQ